VKTIKLTGSKTIKLVSKLIRNEFDLPSEEFWRKEQKIKLIKLARKFELNELANEMQNDL